MEEFEWFTNFSNKNMAMNSDDGGDAVNTADTASNADSDINAAHVNN